MNTQSEFSLAGTPQKDRSHRSVVARSLSKDLRDSNGQAGAEESSDSQTAIDPLSKVHPHES